MVKSSHWSTHVSSYVPAAVARQLIDCVDDRWGLSSGSSSSPTRTGCRRSPFLPASVFGRSIGECRRVYIYIYIYMPGLHGYDCWRRLVAAGACIPCQSIKLHVDILLLYYRHHCSLQPLWASSWDWSLMLVSQSSGIALLCRPRWHAYCTTDEKAYTYIYSKTRHITIINNNYCPTERCEWRSVGGDLECMYKACQTARTDGGLFTYTG